MNSDDWKFRHLYVDPVKREQEDVPDTRRYDVWKAQMDEIFGDSKDIKEVVETCEAIIDTWPKTGIPWPKRDIK